MNLARLLAETPNTEDPTRFLGPAVAVVLGIVVLAVAFQWVRKRLNRDESGPPVGFTLGDLRRLVKEGKMTPEEFERAKNNVLEATKKGTQVKPAQETTVPKEFPPRA
jgi:hypothetical protein